MTPHAWQFLSGMCVTVIGALGTPAPVTGTSNDAIELSPDGVVFFHEFSGLLAGAVLVPQSSATDRLYVRNTSESDGYVRIGLSNTAPTTPALVDVLSLEISSPERTWGPTSFTAADPCVEVAYNLPLPAGATVPIDARVLLGDLIATNLQTESATFTLELVMTPTPGPPSLEGCFAATPGHTPQPSPTALGVTGAHIPILTIVAAVGITTAGIAALTNGKRRRNTRDPE